MKKHGMGFVKKSVLPNYDSGESSSEASSESTINISASYSQPYTNEVQVVKIQSPPPKIRASPRSPAPPPTRASPPSPAPPPTRASPPASPPSPALPLSPAPPINEPALQSNPDPDPDPEECNFQDSTLAPFVFRQHLMLVKREEETLLKLQSDLEHQRARCALGLNPSQCEGLLADHGSKTNLITDATGHHIGVKEKPSLKPEDLNLSNRLTIQDLLAKPFVTRKGFLLCRNAVLPVLSYANDRYLLNTIVEDMDPSIALSVEIACELKDAENIFQSLQKPFLNNMEPSSVILLQTPTLSERTTSNGIVHCVQVDSINDVKFLPQSFQSLIPPTAGASDSPKTGVTGEDEHLVKRKASQFVSLSCEEKVAALEWKKWGNEYSIARLHSQALFAYDVALRFDPQGVDVRASRCASLINLGLYGAALTDADYITSHDPFNTAFILREVTCLWGLDRFEDAAEYLKTLLNALTTSPDFENRAIIETRKKGMFIQQIIVKTEKIIQQRELPEQFGNDKYFRTPTKLFSDEPEYYKPIDVVDQDARNQKYIVIANQKVKAGKLLVITKAFSAMYLDETAKLLSDPSDELINSVIQKLRLEKPTLYQANRSNSEEPQNISPTQFDLPGASNSEAREFCRKHFYCGGSKMSASGASSPFLRVVGGVWTFPKNIRHVCVGGNAIWYTCGNLLFVRAVRDIEKFEEITMAHVEPTESYEIRTHILQAKGLVCNCPLCQVESTESDQIKLKRIGLLNETRVLSNSSGNDWSKEFSNHEKWKLNYAIEDLLLLRSGYAKLNFPIVEPLYNYGVYLMNNNNFEEAITAFEKAFFVVDNTIAVFLLINLSLRLAYCYMARTKGKDKGRAKKWFTAARSYAMLTYGCMEPVKLTYKQEFDYLEKRGVA